MGVEGSGWLKLFGGARLGRLGLLGVVVGAWTHVSVVVRVGGTNRSVRRSLWEWVPAWKCVSTVGAWMRGVPFLLVICRKLGVRCGGGVGVRREEKDSE